MKKFHELFFMLCSALFFLSVSSFHQKGVVFSIETAAIQSSIKKERDPLSTMTFDSIIQIPNTLRGSKNKLWNRNNIEVNNSNIDCDCQDYLYVNDESENLTHKFSFNVSTGQLTEIGSPWLPASAGLTAPHGIVQDLNGYLYIANGATDGDLVKLDVFGNILTNPFIDNANQSLGQEMRTTNFISKDGILYMMENANRVEILAIELCTGTELGRMQIDGGANRGPLWDIKMDGTNWYIPSRGDNAIYTGSLDTSLFTSPAIHSGSKLFDLQYGRPMGMTIDENGNFYVVEDQNFPASRATPNIVKYDSNGNYLMDIEETNNGGSNNTDGQSGWWGARGIAYSGATGRLYVGSKENCVAVFDTNLNELSTLNIGNPTDGDPKAIGIITECCPGNNNETIDVSYCYSGTDTTIFLQDILLCEDIIAEGIWNESSSNSNFSFFDCNNSVVISGDGGCAQYTLISDGTGTNAQCSNFNITINLCSTCFSCPVTQCTDIIIDGTNIASTSPVCPGNNYFNWADINWNNGTGFNEITSQAQLQANDLDPAADRDSIRQTIANLDGSGVGAVLTVAGYRNWSGGPPSNPNTPGPNIYATNPDNCTDALRVTVGRDTTITIITYDQAIPLCTFFTGGNNLRFTTANEEGTNVSWLTAFDGADGTGNPVLPNFANPEDGISVDPDNYNEATLNTSTGTIFSHVDPATVGFSTSRRGYTVYDYNGAMVRSIVLKSVTLTRDFSSRIEDNTSQWIGGCTSFNANDCTAATRSICDDASNSVSLEAPSAYTNIVWYNEAGTQVGTGNPLVVNSNTTGLSDGMEEFYYEALDGNSCPVELCCPVVINTTTCVTCTLSSAGISEEECVDNGTAMDSSDDYVRFRLSPMGSNTSTFSVTADNGATVTRNDGSPATNQAYGNNFRYRLQDGSANGTTYTITITDDSDPNCTVTTQVTQNKCSIDCPPQICLPINIVIKRTGN